jgi:tetratricopeptide (TPR) repeat protein
MYSRTFDSALALIAALALTACAARAPDTRDNTALRQKIHTAVPASWREAVATADDISPLAMTPELREFVHAAVRRSTDREERMLALTRAIMGDKGLGLMPVSEATHTAIEAFQSGTGNCIGFSNLLIASAREVGLNAHYELVSHWPDWDKVGNVLVASQHIRVVSRVAGKRLVFDFYQDPIEPSFSARPLSDDDALAHHVNNLAMAAMGRGEDAYAYALMSKAIESSPGSAFIWSNLGILLSRHDLDSLAEAALREALLIEPDGLSALSNLQSLFMRQGRYEEARRFDSQVEKYRARNPYYHAWLGQRAYEQGNFEKAVGHFKDAISRKKNERDFYVQLSKSYEQLGTSHLALKARNKARAID